MRDESTWLEKLDKEFANDPEYIVHGILLDITEDICRAMEQQGITRSELANRLGVSRQYVTNFLNTPTNTTLKSIVQFAQAVGLEVSLEQRPTDRVGRESHPQVWEQPAQQNVFPAAEPRRRAMPRDYRSIERHEHDASIPAAA